jgi:putative FmdB family regulatory protein
MPKYSYKCTQCECVLSFYHSINDKKTDCTECEAEDSLQRQPSKFNLYKQEKSNKVGNLVNKSIKEFGEELKQEKDKLRNEFFDTDE